MAGTQIANEDKLFRAMTGGGGFRIMAINATQMVQAAIDAQNIPHEEHARVLAELLVGAVLMREAMAPEQRLQMVLRNKFSGSFTVDSHPDGMTRGIVQFPLDVPVEFGEYTLLKVIREMTNHQLHQGVVETAEEAGVSAALTNYLLSSEQLHSVLEVGCVFEDGKVLYAGGYLVQMLPGAHVDELKAVTEVLEGLPGVESLLNITQADPLVLLGALFGPLPHRILAEAPVFFGCNCSHTRILTALTTLNQTELNELIADDESITIDCDYCGKHYELDREQVIAIADSP